MEFRDSRFDCSCSRDGVVFMELHNMGSASDDDWTRALSEGLGATFEVHWEDAKYPDDDPRLLRRGETLFDVLRAAGLNPEWDGTVKGKFTITAFDTNGARLALAMALHPSMASHPTSRLSHVRSLALCLVACRSCRYSERDAAPHRSARDFEYDSQRFGA